MLGCAAGRHPPSHSGAYRYPGRMRTGYSVIFFAALHQSVVGPEPDWVSLAFALPELRGLRTQVSRASTQCS
jgi:hypothetical protein